MTPSTAPPPRPARPRGPPRAVLRRRARCSCCAPRDTSGRAGRARHRAGLARRSRSAPTRPSWAARWAYDGCRHIVDAIDTALRERVPVVGIWHSGGARLAEGVTALHAVGEVFAAMVRASGRIPQISVVLGPAAGGAAYGPALTDLVIMGPAGRVFVTGPDVVRSVTGENVDMESLGGPDTHGRRSGVVHVVTDSEPAALETARAGRRPAGRPGRVRPGRRRARRRPRARMLPEQTQRAYDVKPLIADLLDGPGPGAAPAVRARTSSPRSAGWPGAPSGSSPTTRCAWAAAWTPRRRRRRPGSCGCATRSGCRWSSLVDVPGYLPGVGQEWDGVVRRGAKLLHAFAEAVVPRVTLVTRKSYGGAYIAMNARSLGATAVFAWPGAEVAVMGAKAAVGILHRKKLAAAAARRARGAARPAGRGARADRRRGQPGAADRRRRRGRRAAADPAPAGGGAGRRPARPRRARQHPAVAAASSRPGDRSS